MASVDMSWRSCGAGGFRDTLFGTVCNTTTDPHAIAVTASALFLTEIHDSNAFARLDPAGDAVLVTRPLMDIFAVSLGWMSLDAGGESRGTVPYDWIGDGTDRAYRFLIEPGGVPGSSMRARFTFELTLPRPGRYAVYFEGCCRWPDIGNPGASGARPGPWWTSAEVRLDPMANPPLPVASPVVKMPRVEIRRTQRIGALAFVLSGRGGVMLESVLDAGASIEGRYDRFSGADAKIYLDGGLVVRRGGGWDGFVREDGNYSIVWYAAPDNLPQFQSTRALAYGPTWVIVRGDVRERVGMQPISKSAGDALAHGIGGVWSRQSAEMDSGMVGGGARLAMPSYVKGAVEMAWTGRGAVLQYTNAFQVQSAAQRGGDTVRFSLCDERQFGAGHSRIAEYPKFTIQQPMGTTIDQQYGVVMMPSDTPAGVYDMCVRVESMGVASQVDFSVLVRMHNQTSDIPVALYGQSFTPETTPRAPMVVPCGEMREVPIAFRSVSSAGPLPGAVLAATSLPRRYASLNVSTVDATGVLHLQTACGDVEFKGVNMACFQAASFMAASVPEGCLYFNVTDPSVADPVAPPPTPPTTTPPAPMVTTMVQPPLATPPPEVQREDPEEQLKRGFVDILYESDLSLIPDQAYLAKFDTGGLCAGTRDEQVQANVTDTWNAQNNNFDSPTRGMYYVMGPELVGEEQSLEGVGFKWGCVTPRRYWVALARVEEATGVQGAQCWHCWSKV